MKREVNLYKIITVFVLLLLVVWHIFHDHYSEYQEIEYSDDHGIYYVDRFENKSINLFDIDYIEIAKPGKRDKGGLIIDDIQESILNDFKGESFFCIIPNKIICGEYGVIENPHIIPPINNSNQIPNPNILSLMFFVIFIRIFLT